VRQDDLGRAREIVAEDAGGEFDEP
jgi:hypothetical protein